MRKTAPDLCADDMCSLSNGAAHAGPCEPCDCEVNDWGRPTPHAIMECPKNFPKSEFTIEERLMMHQMRKGKTVPLKRFTRKDIVDYVAKNWPVNTRMP